MIFSEGEGEGITRRYKLIVSLWIIPLVLATPLLLRASSAGRIQRVKAK